MAIVLSFKEYVQSKDRLKDALDEAPYQIVEYVTTKYVKLKTLQAEEITIRPNYRLMVEWVYNNDIPTAVNIILTSPDGTKSIQLDEKELSAFPRWVKTNTKLV